MEMNEFENFIQEGNGYDWNKGKSNNAVYAEEKGLVNATNLSKILKIKSAFILEHAPYEEWHHTSLRFNETKYYNIEDVKKWFEKHGKYSYELWLKAKEKEVGIYKAICSEEWFQKEYCFGRSGRKGGYVHYQRTFKATIIDKGHAMVDIKVRKGTICDVKRFGEHYNTYKMKKEVFRKKKNSKKFTIVKID